jgi:hypothetical protein
MAKDNLEGFKIGDLKRPQIRPSRGAAATGSQDAPEPAPSVGFPAVEARLEANDVDAVADELRATYERLEALSQGGDVKTRSAAAKAMVAYERTADLFEYLFTTKDALGRGGQ